MSDEPSCSNVLDPQLPRCAWLLACSVSRKDASPQSSASARRIPVRILSGNGVHRFRNHCSTSPEYAYGGQDGLMGAVLHKFKQSSKKKTEQAFAEHRDYLLRDIDHLTAQLAEITTLQTLKPYLAARWDQKQMRWDEEEDDMEWLFR